MTAELAHDARERKPHPVVEDLIARIHVNDALQKDVKVRGLEEIAIEMVRHIPTF